MFEELIVPIEDFKFEKCINKDFERWVNIGKDFELNGTRGFSQSNKKVWDISFPYQSPLQGLYKHVNLHLNYHSIVTDSKGKTIHFDSYIQAAKFVQSHFSGLLQQNGIDVNFALKRESNAIYDILPHPAYNKPWISKVCIFGHANQWKITEDLQKNICQTTKIDMCKIFKTRKELAFNLYQILNKDLDKIFQAQDYQMFKEHKIVSPSSWWITFLRPEINLLEIFS